LTEYDANDTLTLLNLAIALARNAQPANAKLHLLRVLARNDIHPQYIADAASQLGELVMAEGDWRQGADEIRRAADANPTNLHIRHALGDLYLAHNEYDLALAQYNQILAANPNHAAAHYVVGMVLYHHKKDIATAMLHLEKAVDLDPRYAQLLTPNSHSHSHHHHEGGCCGGHDPKHDDQAQPHVHTDNCAHDRDHNHNHEHQQQHQQQQQHGQGHQCCGGSAKCDK